MARQFSTSPPAMKRSISKPNGSSIASNTSNTSPRAGVTLSQAISVSASATTSLAFVIPGGVDEAPAADQRGETHNAQDRPRSDSAEQPHRISAALRHTGSGPLGAPPG